MTEDIKDQEAGNEEVESETPESSDASDVASDDSNDAAEQADASENVEDEAAQGDAHDGAEDADSGEADVPSEEASEDEAEAAADEAADDEAAEDEAAEDEAAEDEAADDEAADDEAGDDEGNGKQATSVLLPGDAANVAGVAAFFDHPEHLMYAASQARDAKFERFDAFSPFPIHGMDEAMGLGRSWIPWVTFSAGAAGLMTAASLQFGIMGFDWPMVYGGRPFFAWPSFVPIMFELTVLFAGVTTALVMLIAAGCFRKNIIIDKDITNDRFALWIAADDKKFDREQVVEFMKSLNPTEIRTVKKDGN